VPQTLAIPQATRQPVTQALGAPRLLRFWHLSALDAPTVAVTWLLAFAKSAGVRLAGWVPLLLALITWVVYIGDRILDARSALHTGRIDCLRERHLFQWRHRRTFLRLGFAALCCSTWIGLSVMSTEARERNSLLVAAGIIYFSCIHSRRKLQSIFPKELLVGILFTTACALPAFGRVANLSVDFIGVVGFFATLAWLNCQAIDFWESPRKTKFSRQIFFASCALALAGILWASILHATHVYTAELFAAGAMSALFLAYLDRIRMRLTPLALRAAADLVLLTPLVLILQ